MITRRHALKNLALTAGAFIDTETTKIHHDKHHAAYVSKLNAASRKSGRN